MGKNKRIVKLFKIKQNTCKALKRLNGVETFKPHVPKQF